MVSVFVIKASGSLIQQVRAGGRVKTTEISKEQYLLEVGVGARLKKSASS